MISHDSLCRAVARYEGNNACYFVWHWRSLVFNKPSLRGNDTDAAAAGGDASSASGGNAGGHVGSNLDTHTHTHTHTFTHAWGVGVVAG